MDYSPGMEVLLSVLTCGLWNVYWDNRTGKRIVRMSAQVGLPLTDNALLYLNQVWQAAMTGPADGGTTPWPPPPSPTPRRPCPPQI